MRILIGLIAVAFSFSAGFSQQQMKLVDKVVGVGLMIIGWSQTQPAHEKSSAITQMQLFGAVVNVVLVRVEDHRFVLLRLERLALSLLVCKSYHQ